MRKLLILLLLAGLLAGCQQDNDNPSGATPATAGTPATGDATPPTDAVAEATACLLYTSRCV